jgi:acetyltransferase-like isoleucine patch superfamily enzyme
VDLTQNASISAAYGLANTLQGGLNTANANIVIGQGVNNTQNANITIIQGVDLTQNSSISSAFLLANTLQGGLNTANVNIVITQGVDLTQNASIAAAFGTANSANILAQAAFDKANTGSGGGGISASGYLANSIIFANTAGYLSNSSSLQFLTSNNVLIVSGSTTISGNVVIGATSTTYKLQVVGSFAATTKSFVIPHPTKEGKQLRYGSLEGPENGVYIRGRLEGNKIKLPEYWTKLVDPDSITVNLTPIGKHQDLYVENISNNVVTVCNGNLLNKSINCFYTIFAERIDVNKLEVEIE